MVKAQGDVFYDKYIKKVIEAKDAKYFIVEEGDTNYNQFLSVVKLMNTIFGEKGPYYEFECGLVAGRLWLFLMRYIDKMQSLDKSAYHSIIDWFKMYNITELNMSADNNNGLTTYGYCYSDDGITMENITIDKIR